MEGESSVIVRELLAVFGVKYDDSGAQKALTAMDNLAGKAKTLAGVVAGSAALWGIKRLVEQTAGFAESISNTSDRLRMQTDTLQELQYAAEAAGVAHGVLEDALLGFSQRAADAARNGGDLAVAAHRLGVRLTDGLLRVRKPAELLSDLADAFHRMKDESEKTRLVRILFDDDGLKLLRLLEKGSGNLREMALEARKLGLVMSNQEIETAEKLAHLERRFGFIARQLSYKLIQPLIPVLQSAADWLERVGKSFAVASQQTELFKTVSTAMQACMLGLSMVMAYKVLPVLAAICVANWALIASTGLWVAGIALAVLIFEDLMTTIKGGDSLIRRLGHAIANGFSQSVAFIKKEVLALGKWIENALRGLEKRAANFISGFIPDFLVGKDGQPSIDKKVSQFVMDLIPNGDAAVQNPLGLERPAGPSAISSVVNKRTMSQQTTVNAPVHQNVKVHVNVASGADPREIGAQVSKEVRAALDTERRNTYEALTQKAPRTAGAAGTP
jgi:hypothetical protein